MAGGSGGIFVVVLLLDLFFFFSSPAARDRAGRGELRAREERAGLGGGFVVGGLGFAGLYVLTLVVDPGQKDMTIKIPQRDLVLTPVLPQKAAPIVEAAPAPKVDDSKAKVVDTQE